MRVSRRHTRLSAIRVRLQVLFRFMAVNQSQQQAARHRHFIVERGCGRRAHGLSVWEKCGSHAYLG